MSSRSLIALALAGCLLAAGYAAGVRARLAWREARAAAVIADVVERQREFRAGAGRGGYATTLESLVTCVGGGQQAASLDALAAPGYRLTLRAAVAAVSVGTDCRGRPTTSDYIVAAEPVRVGEDGLQAFAAMASGRVFAFFDGVAPREADMAPGGLAVPLDAAF